MSMKAYDTPYSKLTPQEKKLVQETLMLDDWGTVVDTVLPLVY